MLHIFIAASVVVTAQRFSRVRTYTLCRMAFRDEFPLVPARPRRRSKKAPLHQHMCLVREKITTRSRRGGIVRRPVDDKNIPRRRVHRHHRRRPYRLVPWMQLRNYPGILVVAPPRASRKVTTCSTWTRGTNWLPTASGNPDKNSIIAGTTWQVPGRYFSPTTAASGAFFFFFCSVFNDVWENSVCFSCIISNFRQVSVRPDDWVMRGALIRACTEYSDSESVKITRSVSKGWYLLNSHSNDVYIGKLNHEGSKYRGSFSHISRGISDKVQNLYDRSFRHIHTRPCDLFEKIFLCKCEYPWARALDASTQEKTLDTIVWRHILSWLLQNYVKLTLRRRTLLLTLFRSRRDNNNHD